MAIDRVITNSALSHIKDQIFEDLDNSTLAACLLVSKDWHDSLTRLKLRRYFYLVWLMTNSKINIYEQVDAEGNYGHRTRSFLQVFPNWMKLSSHFTHWSRDVALDSRARL